MTEKITRRGFDEEDCNWFSREAIVKLKIAQEEIEWLLNRGYKLSSIIDLIGGHYQFSSRQRTALQRATSSKPQYEKRKTAMLPVRAYKEDCIYIDGFNLIITLEVALSGGALILGNDGALRDLAGLRGTYRLIDKTDEAIKLVGKAFREFEIPSAKFFLDAPVSNSGRLRSKILEYSTQWNIPVEVELVPNADPILSKMKRVVSSDSIILNQCSSWFNLSREIVELYINDAWIIKFAELM
jgi:hypothetical protein